MQYRFHRLQVKIQAKTPFCHQKREWSKFDAAKIRNKAQKCVIEEIFAQCWQNIFHRVGKFDRFCEILIVQQIEKLNRSRAVNKFFYGTLLCFLLSLLIVGET